MICKMRKHVELPLRCNQVDTGEERHRESQRQRREREGESEEEVET